MIIKLLSVEVPRFWEPIKKAVQAANEVDDKHLRPYLNELLHALLNDKAQCFVRLDENRTLEALAITRVLHDNQRDEKYLYVQTLFSWQIQTDDVWQRDIAFMKRFAESEGCRYIGCMSHNPGAWRIFKIIGMKEDNRIYALRLDG